jgi:hypothetical protein
MNTTNYVAPSPKAELSQAPNRLFSRSKTPCASSPGRSHDVESRSKGSHLVFDEVKGVLLLTRSSTPTKLTNKALPELSVRHSIRARSPSWIDG